jgi:hypothetical protein
LRLGEQIVRLDFFQFRQRTDRERPQIADARRRRQTNGMNPQPAIRRDGDFGFYAVVDGGQFLHFKAGRIEQQLLRIGQALTGKGHFHFGAALHADGGDLAEVRFDGESSGNRQAEQQSRKPWQQTSSSARFTSFCQMISRRGRLLPRSAQP